MDKALEDQKLHAMWTCIGYSRFGQKILGFWLLLQYLNEFLGVKTILDIIPTQLIGCSRRITPILFEWQLENHDKTHRSELN